MNNTINVTVELGPESQAKLDKILEALQGIRPNCHSCVETAVGMTKDLAEAATAPQSAENTPAPEIAHPVEEVTAPAEPEPEKKVTLADIQALVVKLAAPGTPEKPSKKDKVRAIVKEYAERVGLIPEDKFGEVMDKLTALDKEG